MKPTCFVSYSHQDVDRVVLDYIIGILKQIMEDNVNIVYDTDELQPGDNLDKFMNKVLDVDVTILILTPSYKEKVDKRQDGVYNEFTKIINRYWEIEQKLSTNSSLCVIERFQIIPVLLSGSANESIPEQIRNIFRIDLVGFSVIKDHRGEFVVTDHIKKKYLPTIKKIVETLNIAATLKSKKFHDSLTYYYKELFVNLKASEYMIKDIPGFVEDIFLQTESFSKVKSQISYFLIGRKGSGKSTIATVLPIIDKYKYNGTIIILADNIDLKSAYHSLKDATRSDIETILPTFSFFYYSWQGFLCLCLLNHLVLLNNEKKLTDNQKSFLEPIKEYINSFTNNHPTDDLKGTFFSFSINKLQEFLDLCIQKARDSKGNSFFLSDIKLSFNFEEYLIYLLELKVVNALNSIIDNCRKRVLLTLDGFDTIFDTFRRGVKLPDLQVRSKFEVEWLRSLLLLIFDIKDHKLKNTFFKTLDFCITIPKDRYLEIESTDRDGFRYNNRTCHILWSGIELCVVLFKRLEKMSGFQTSESLKPHERLDQICGKLFKGWPKEVSFDFNGKLISIPMFAYVLRHTFWRPRDILLYYSSLLAAILSCKKTGNKISDIIVRRIISETTYQIIKTEFIDEYETTVTNIREIIDKFTGCNQVLCYAEIEKVLSGINFIFSLGDKETNIYSKIEFLYDIGFLGIILSDRQKEILKIEYSQAFYFNEGTTALSATKKVHFKETKFAIHPIFAENLQLDSSKNDFLLNFTWDYLYSNNIIQAAARNQF